LTRTSELIRFQSLDLALILSLSFRPEHRGLAAVLRTEEPSVVSGCQRSSRDTVGTDGSMLTHAPADAVPRGWVESVDPLPDRSSVGQFFSTHPTLPTSCAPITHRPRTKSF
jgi:hypothetical protein